jgi:hypothetical protein
LDEESEPASSEVLEIVYEAIKLAKPKERSQCVVAAKRPNNLAQGEGFA